MAQGSGSGIINSLKDGQQLVEPTECAQQLGLILGFRLYPRNEGLPSLDQGYSAVTTLLHHATPLAIEAYLALCVGADFPDR